MDCKATARTGRQQIAGGAKLESNTPAVLKRAIYVCEKFGEVPKVKSPPTTTFPSGCNAIAQTALLRFGSAKLASVEPSAFNRAR